MMATRRSVYIAAALAAVMGAAAGAGLSSRQEAPAAAPPEAVRLQGPAGDPERSARQVALLGQELASMRAELAAVRSQVAQARAPAAPAPPEEVEDGEAMYQARIAAVDAAFRGEPGNPRWADSAGASIRDALAAARIDASLLRNLECRTRTCRIELTGVEASNFQKSFPMFALQLAPTLPEITANRVDERTTVLYLSANP